VVRTTGEDETVVRTTRRVSTLVLLIATVGVILAQTSGSQAMLGNPATFSGRAPSQRRSDDR